MRNIFLYCLVAGILSSCHFFKKKNENVSSEEPTSEPVARVYNSYLYEEDLNGLVIGEFTQKDSLNFIKRYINSWVRKQVLLKKAEKNIEGSLSEIEKKVADYRYDLMVYEYQKKYINEKLEKKITDAEIKKFYEENKSNFELKQNIVKCEFARIPLNVPKLNKALYWFKSTKSKDQKKYKEFVHEFSDSYSFEDEIWYDFNEIVINTPFATFQNQVKFLKSKKLSKQTDSTHVYLLKIIDYKISDDISPLEFVRERIKDVIINKRKVDLIQNMEDGIYKQAEKKKDFEIFN